MLLCLLQGKPGKDGDPGPPGHRVRFLCTYVHYDRNTLWYIIVKYLFGLSLALFLLFSLLHSSSLTLFFFQGALGEPGSPGHPGGTGDRVRFYEATHIAYCWLRSVKVLTFNKVLLVICWWGFVSYYKGVWDCKVIDLLFIGGQRWAGITWPSRRGTSYYVCNY